MSLLRHTPVLHDALQHVAEERVIAHDPWEPRAQFSWATGGEMTPAEVEALSILLHGKLIAVLPVEQGCREHSVKVTFEGADRLPVWRACDHGERAS